MTLLEEEAEGKGEVDAQRKRLRVPAACLRLPLSEDLYDELQGLMGKTQAGRVEEGVVAAERFMR